MNPAKHDKQKVIVILNGTKWSEESDTLGVMLIPSRFLSGREKHLTNQR